MTDTRYLITKTEKAVCPGQGRRPREVLSSHPYAGITQVRFKGSTALRAVLSAGLSQLPLRNQFYVSALTIPYFRIPVKRPVSEGYHPKVGARHS